MTKKRCVRLVVGMGEEPSYSPLKISAEIHEAVMALPPQERRDREKVNGAVREGLKLGRCGPLGVRTYMAFEIDGRIKSRRSEPEGTSATIEAKSGTLLVMPVQPPDMRSRSRTLRRAIRPTPSMGSWPACFVSASHLRSI